MPANDGVPDGQGVQAESGQSGTGTGTGPRFGGLPQPHPQEPPQPQLLPTEPEQPLGGPYWGMSNAVRISADAMILTPDNPAGSGWDDKDNL
jgi:hypothetical protein